MSLLENPTNYNLSEKNFSIGVAIFDIKSKEIVEFDDFPLLLQTLIVSADSFNANVIGNALKPCNTTNGDFRKINLNANFD